MHASFPELLRGNLLPASPGLAHPQETWLFILIQSLFLAKLLNTELLILVIAK